MPDGFADCEEAQLDKAKQIIPSAQTRDALRNWWLAVPTAQRATTPNWDIACTCVIHGKPGILLVEAKAHERELIGGERCVVGCIGWYGTVELEAIVEHIRTTIRPNVLGHRVRIESVS